MKERPARRPRETAIHRLFGLHSLHGRYRLAAVGMTLIVIVGAWMTLDYVSARGSLTTTNMTDRNEVVQHSRLLRNGVWDAEFALQNFLLAPTVEQRRRVESHLRDALVQTTRLDTTRWVRDAGLNGSVEEIRAALAELDGQVERLMDIRVDPEQLFPAMKIMRDLMEPANNSFYTAATLAMEDALATRPEPGNWEVYRLLEQARHSWSRMISTFRVYVVNRTGTFGSGLTGLRQQAHNVRLFWAQILKHLERLRQLDELGQLTFQVSSSLEEMQQYGEQWMQGFEATNQIYDRTDWRTDAPIMRDQVQPLFAQIRGHLVRLDQALEESAGEDVSLLARMAKGMSHGLWVLIAVSLALFFFAFAYFERSVLQPIAQVARALKGEARGTENVELPRVDADETRDLVEAFAEMRKQVHRRQMALEYQATHDALTDLPNRILLMDRLHQALLTAQRNGDAAALLVLDLNRFKEINDTLGHETGDQLLQKVRRRLLGILRETDTVARLGGDEFAVLLPTADEAAAVKMAERVMAELGRAYTVDMHTLYVGSGLGIAVFPRHGEDAQTLIQRAEVAMYEAKRGNRGFTVYDSEMDQHSLRRLALESDLHDAIRDDSLQLFYQPKLSLRSGRTTGVEALIRWFHPERGFVPPDELISVAEATGLIKPLTRWVIQTALRQVAEWRAKGIEISIAVNLSVWNIQDRELVEQIREGLESWGVPPSSLELEITESAMMADPNRALEILTELDAMGMSLAVDDFGTGYSSLAYLKRLPVDALKIDKSFVMGMIEDENDAAIVRSTIDLAHNLGLKVVAEGVESHEHWTVLDLLGCDTAQGYYMSKPIPAPDFEAWLDGAQAPLPQARPA